MPGKQIPQPKQLFQDSAWNPLVGGQIFTYAAGTLTAKATFQDDALTIANTNPTIVDARGEASMHGLGVYRIILKDSVGNTIYDVDNIESVASIFSAPILGRLIRTTVYVNDNAGGNLISVNGAGFAANSSPFVAMTNTTVVDVEVLGAGGAGGGTPVVATGQVSCAGGGGAGAYVTKRITSGFSNITVTAGTPGNGVAGGAGQTGGTSSFGTLISCAGGAGGAAGSSIAPGFFYAPGGGGGAVLGAPNGSIVAPGGQGDYGLYNSTPLGGAGGVSANGPGGNYVFGTSNGSQGLSPGSGGGGAASAPGAARSGGSGIYGLVTVKEYS